MTTAPLTPGGARARAARRVVASAGLTVAAALASGACSEAITDPNTPVAISFDSLPAPSVVEGDTMRDPVTGLVAPLNAQAYNSSGDTIPNAPFTYFVRDTGNLLTVADGKYLVAVPGRHTTQVTLLASLNGLQLPQKIYITPMPQVLLREKTGVPSLTLAVPDNATNVSADSLGVRVMHDSLGADTVPVQAWIVRYTVEYGAETLADSVRLVAPGGTVASPADTTDGSGLASRIVRVFAKENTTSGTLDSVVVRAHATYKGAEISGSPMRFVVPLAR